MIVDHNLSNRKYADGTQLTKLQEDIMHGCQKMGEPRMQITKSNMYKHLNYWEYFYLLFAEDGKGDTENQRRT